MPVWAAGIKPLMSPGDATGWRHVRFRKQVLAAFTV